jgi:predicted dehydrogenase
MLRAAVVGCGTIGTGGRAPAHPDVGVDTHAGAYFACADTELVGVADLDPPRARAAARRFPGAQAYTAADDLLQAAKPELVSVCTPDHTHAELLEWILRAPNVRGVLAEKPLAGGSARAAALTRLAVERGVVLAVNYRRRFVPAVASLARAVAAGQLGELQHVHGSYCKGLRHNGTHWLDLLRMLAREPVAVRGWDRLMEGGDDPSLDAELILAGGAGARLAALQARAFTVFELELTGTAGRVRLADSGHRIEHFFVGPDERHPGHRGLIAGETEDGALRDATRHAVADLVRCVRDGGAPACGGQDATQALVLAEAISTSAANDGRIVAVSSPIQGTMV